MASHNPPVQISQDMLAAKAGIHRNVVGRIERGEYNPTVMTLAAIATALNTSMVDAQAISR
jgi:DNA-binding XRE family transcriptional regulator